MIRADGPESLLVIVPAWNEEGAVGVVVRSIREHLPGVPVLVIDDYSRDGTVLQAREAGADVLSLPHHLGLGGCVQAGYRLAFELGYHRVVRIDGDGQHDPGDIARLLETLERTGCDMVIGARSADSPYKASLPRRMGITFFKALLRPILGRQVSDPTSGFVAVNRRALQVFSRSFPLEYPEIERARYDARWVARFVSAYVNADAPTGEALFGAAIADGQLAECLTTLAGSTVATLRNRSSEA